VVSTSAALQFPLYIYIHYTRYNYTLEEEKTLSASRFFSLRLGWFFHLLSTAVNLFRVSSPFKLAGLPLSPPLCSVSSAYTMAVLRSICIICVRTLYVSILTSIYIYIYITAHNIYMYTVYVLGGLIYDRVDRRTPFCFLVPPPRYRTDRSHCFRRSREGLCVVHGVKKNV
jgi:hypothetical protein